MKRPALVLVAFWALVGPLAFATPPTAASDSDRPKIGLVLSGGGARGSAHVGVIKVMEELRIPVDYVVGTSMGSIVGGFYASGLSPAEMEEVFRTVDWGRAFNDQPDRKRISFRRKEDDFDALLPFELGVGRRGLTQRSGVISGQKINLVLRGTVAHVVGIDAFDDLRVPFRAIAADLQTGDVVVLDRGDLALAMRASMSVPGAFTPVEIDGRILVDGGIASNLPVAVAHRMGAEKIIAIDVGTPPKGVGESLSAVGVVSQTFSVLNKRNVLESKKLLEEDDVLIVPELGDLGSSAFDRMLEGVAIGERAARGVEAELRRFSVSEREFAEHLERQRWSGDVHEEVIVDRIEVAGLTNTNPNFISRRLKSKPGWQVQAVLDQLDSVFFPRHGSLVTVDGFFSRDHLGADDDYDKVDLGALTAWSRGSSTLLAGLEYGTDLGSDIPFYDEFELGGFLNLSGLTRGQLQGDVKALGTLGYYWRMFELGALGRGFYLGGVAQAGDVWQDTEDIEFGDLTYSGTVFAGLDTVLAPVYVGWGLAENGQDEFYLFIGRPFD